MGLPLTTASVLRSGVAFAAIWEDPTPVTTHAGRLVTQGGHAMKATIASAREQTIGGATSSPTSPADFKKFCAFLLNKHVQVVHSIYSIKHLSISQTSCDFCSKNKFYL